MGILANFIGSLLTKTIFKGTVKQLDSMIDSDKRKEVADSAKKLRETIEKYNASLNNPEFKKMIKGSGKTIEDFKIKKL